MTESFLGVQNEFDITLDSLSRLESITFDITTFDSFYINPFIRCHCVAMFYGHKSRGRPISPMVTSMKSTQVFHSNTVWLGYI